MLIDASAAFDVPFLLTTSAGAPVDADAAPTFRVYGFDGAVGDSTATLFESGTITGCTAASPAVVTTSAAHGLSTGAVVTIASVGGVSGVNGTRRVTVVSSTTFSLNGTTGTGTYTSGGTWNTTGLYSLPFAGQLLAALEAGKSYLVVVTGEISSVAFTRSFAFTAV